MRALRSELLRLLLAVFGPSLLFFQMRAFLWFRRRNAQRRPLHLNPMCSVLKGPLLACWPTSVACRQSAGNSCFWGSTVPHSGAFLASAPSTPFFKPTFMHIRTKQNLRSRARHKCARRGLGGRPPRGEGRPHREGLAAAVGSGAGSGRQHRLRAREAYPVRTSIFSISHTQHRTPPGLNHFL